MQKHDKKKRVTSISVSELIADEKKMIDEWIEERDFHSERIKATYKIEKAEFYEASKYKHWTRNRLAGDDHGWIPIYSLVLAAKYKVLQYVHWRIGMSHQADRIGEEIKYTKCLHEIAKHVKSLRFYEAQLHQQMIA